MTVSSNELYHLKEDEYCHLISFFQTSCFHQKITEHRYISIEASWSNSTICLNYEAFFILFGYEFQFEDFFISHDINKTCLHYKNSEYFIGDHFSVSVSGLSHAHGYASTVILCKCQGWDYMIVRTCKVK